MKLLKVILSAALWLLLFEAGQASIGAGDPMLHEGQIVDVSGFELSDALKAKVNNLEKARGYYQFNSANADGFYADLEVVDKRLYLNGLWIGAMVEDFKGGRQPVPLNLDEGQKGLFASWFTGSLVRYYEVRVDGQMLRFTRSYVFKEGVLTSVTVEQLK